MYNFSVFIKDLMGAALNSSISTNEFVSQLIEYTTDNFDICNKNGEVLSFSKSRISDLMRNKTELPKSLKEITRIFGHQQNFKTVVQAFADDMLDKTLLDETVYKLKNHINDSENLNANQKSITEENDTVTFITNAYILAIKVNNIINSDKEVVTVWESGSNSIDVILGDIFKFGFDNRKKKRRIIVIPVNSTFETHITTQTEITEYPLVSENTLHGMWLSRMFKSGLDESTIQKRIDENLESENVTPIASSRIGRKKVYPIGTISTIITGASVFYLTAISNFNEKGKACIRGIHSDKPQ